MAVAVKCQTSLFLPVRAWRSVPCSLALSSRPKVLGSELGQGWVISTVQFQDDWVGFWVCVYRDNGKENGNYYSTMGLYRDNGKENGNYYGLGGARVDMLNSADEDLAMLTACLMPAWVYKPFLHHLTLSRITLSPSESCPY